MADSLSIILHAADALTARVLRDALASESHGIKPLAVLTDESASAEQMAAWKQAGLTVTVFKNPDAGSRLRLGAVLARIRRSLKDSMAATGSIAFGRFILDLSHLSLTDNGTGLVSQLTEKERDILARLYDEGGQALDRRRLLQDVWGYAAQVETHTLETHIYRLRQKLESDPSNPVLLVTDGAGYRLAL